MVRLSPYWEGGVRHLKFSKDECWDQRQRGIKGKKIPVIIEMQHGEQVFSPRLSVGTDVVLALGIPARTAFVSQTQTQRIVGMPSHHCEGEEQGNRL